MKQPTAPTHNIEIDEGSGFCFGVVTAIRKAEEELEKSGRLYCIGDIVHNNDEVERLKKKGLITISHEELSQLHYVKVLLRAHGEPPETYELAKRNNVEIIDATCPVVLQLQKRIKKSFDDSRNDGKQQQIVIYGKHGHAEVNGLVGQTNGEAIVVENEDELSKIDFMRPVTLYSQTTKSVEGYKSITEKIKRNISSASSFKSFNTICRNVANRVEKLKEFASSHDVIIFVSDNKSSNGKYLFSICKEINPKSFFISNESELDLNEIKRAGSIGICGATSTPRWLMEQIRNYTQDNIAQRFAASHEQTSS